MAGLIILLLIIIGLCIVLPLVAMAKASGAANAVEDLKAKVRDLEAQIFSLRSTRIGVREPPSTMAAAEPARAAEPDRPPGTVTVPLRPTAEPTSVPPPLPVETVKTPPAPVPPKTPPPVDAPAWSPPQPAVSMPKIEWEQFMGAKLFAWIGGIAFFLGVAFFVKYSFEHNLIPPEVRVAIGFLVGLALMVGGLMLKRKENVVTAQTLCATGVLILYSVTFACHSYYHFAFFGLIPTFALMTLITATAFLLALRMDAMVVAILGIAGGFLTPVLLSTGQDNPYGLFGYIALLDIGLLLVARRKEWPIVPLLGAIGTVLMQIGWVGKFFEVSQYFAGTKTFVPMAVFLGFAILFLVALRSIRKDDKSDEAMTASAMIVGGAALLWSFYFLGFKSIALRPGLLFSYVFLADAVLVALVFLRTNASALSAAAGMLVFVFLAVWTGRFLTNDQLYYALGAYFVFAALHTAIPLLLQRWRDVSVPGWCHLFPVLALVLVMIPIFTLPAVSFMVWPLILCVDVLAIALAAFTGTLIPILGVLLLTFVIVGSWVLRIPITLVGLPTSLGLMALFTLFFMAASVWATRHLLARRGKAGLAGSLFGDFTEPANFAIQLPALSATLPFLLLIMVTSRLPVQNPSTVFGLALLLVVLLLGMAKILSLEPLAAVALVSTLALEYAWHGPHFVPAHAAIPLPWYLGFAAIFFGFPFLFHRQFASKTSTWAVSALSLPLHFFLLYDAIRRGWPNGVPGLIPAALAIPPLVGLFFLKSRTPADSPSRNAQLALFGGAALFFITLIFPIQFDRQWLTLAWALEGAALCWLFGRVPHPGLRIVGVALLAVVFARLAFNPAVLSYHARSATPIFNWYLYTYGIAAVSMFAAGWFLSPPRERVFDLNGQALLYTLGTILAFLLLNIEIADYFSAPGTRALTFQFQGNFARDMTYSIAWGSFALLLLIAGIRRAMKPVRYAALGLLGVTILKLFLHDLSQLEQLYRIGAFIVVAIIAMVASFLYQRFLGTAVKAEEG